MRDRRHENSKHESRATMIQVLLLFDFYISLPSSLSFRARSNSLPTSTSWYLVFHSSLARGWAAGQSAKDQQINQLGLHLTARVLLNPASCPQRYNTFQRLLSQKSFQNPAKQKTLLLKTEIRRLWSPSKNLCGKTTSTLAQNRRPDWDSRSVRSRFDVTALTRPRFPLRGREPSETRFLRGVDIRGFKPIEKFLRQVTPQNKPYYLS